MDQFQQFFFDFAVSISPALNVLLQSVLTALAALVAAWVKNQIELSRAKLTEAQRYAFDFFVDTSVRAAQQIYGDADGKEKKEYVLDLCEKYVERFGLSISFDEIDAKVEAAVFSVKVLE